jgi:hypothetical protein
MLTRKRARAMGPALGLGDIQREVRQPWLKTRCKRKHVWVASIYNRRCSRCGLEEEKDLVTKSWVESVPANDKAQLRSEVE